MLENKRARSIHARASTTDMKQVTLAVTLKASGRMLPPMLIFKGMPSTNSDNYLCQPKAWMDEHAMTKWIDLMLIPWKNATAPGVVPILILDAYCVYMMGNIVNLIQSLGVEIIHISAGCFTCVSPLMWALEQDEGQVGRIEGDGIVDGAAKEPSKIGGRMGLECLQEL